jgi:hypothetical protein
MKKTIPIFGIIILLLTTLAFAISYSDILHISELSQWDFNTVNLHRARIGYQKISDNWHEISEIDTLRQINETHVVYEQRRVQSAPIKHDDLMSCVADADYTTGQCRAWGKMTLDLSTKKQEREYRQMLVDKYQPNEGNFSFE